MNILLINHYAGSLKHGMEYRPYYLAREWVKEGHKVRIVAATESHLRKIKPTTIKNITIENIDGIEYCWVKSSHYNGNGIGRAINLLSFATQIHLRSKKIVQNFKPDIVIASSPHPFIIKGAKKISDKNASRLIFEVRDLWPLSLVELSGMPKYHPFIYLMQKSEDAAYKYSDKIISLLPQAKKHMINRGMSKGKFVYIPNGIYTQQDDIQKKLPPKLNEKILQFKKDFNFTVGFAGSHGLVNSLDDLINSAKLLDHVGFILLGSGDNKTALMKQAKDMNLHNVLFLDTIEKNRVNAFYALNDVLFIGLKKHPLFRFGVSPNKLFDYMLSGKPIIFAIESGNDPVAEAGCGISCPPENPQEIAKAIMTLKRLSKEDLTAMGKAGKRYVEKNHDYSVLAKKYLKEII